MKVYRYMHGGDTTEVCDLGCEHRVSHHEVILITETGSSYELVPYLDYDKPAFGTVRFGKDNNGNTYTKTPTWNGGDPWVRDGDEDAVFWPRPIVRRDVARDQYGTVIGRNV